MKERRGEKNPLWHISPNQCFKISSASANWLHLNLGMSPFAVALERRWAAARHVVRKHIPNLKLTSLGTASHNAFHLFPPSAQSTAPIRICALDPPHPPTPRRPFAYFLLRPGSWDRRQINIGSAGSVPCVRFPGEPVRPLDESNQSPLWDNLSAATTAHLHPGQQTVKGMSP